jgi:hypothetical protein
VSTGHSHIDIGGYIVFVYLSDLMNMIQIQTGPDPAE